MSLKDVIVKTYSNYEEFINYFVVGVLTTLISLATKYALLFTVLNPENAMHVQIAVGVSWLLAVVFAYYANRKYVFKSKNEDLKSEMTKFFGARVVTLVIEAFVTWFFINFLGFNSKPEVVFWTLVSTGIVFVSNYILSKVFVFKDVN